MGFRATWTITVVATVVATGVWLFGIGHLVWPAHPDLALCLLTIAATVATSILVEHRARRALSTRR